LAQPGTGAWWRRPDTQPEHLGVSLIHGTRNPGIPGEPFRRKRPMDIRAGASAEIAVRRAALAEPFNPFVCFGSG
jgi:hypothetical protein